ncbi:MAG: 2,3-bisphosphoglycerate-dependent phosphoglycerate mutase [Planctomycetota bacterium]
MTELVLLRHGQSLWNAEGRLTGWTNVPLTERGREEGREAGRALRERGHDFDVIHTSLLQRAVTTAALVLDSLEPRERTIRRAWQLNERHYGTRTGAPRPGDAGAVEPDGPDAWWGSRHGRPPAFERGDPRNPANDPRYGGLDRAQRPCTESLADVLERVSTYWRRSIRPDLTAGRRVLIVGHGNALALLATAVEGSSASDPVAAPIPTGGGVVYAFDRHLGIESRFDMEPARRGRTGTVDRSVGE